MFNGCRHKLSSQPVKWKWFLLREICVDIHSLNLENCMGISLLIILLTITWTAMCPFPYCQDSLPIHVQSCRFHF
jgi:hypothetical protein